MQHPNPLRVANRYLYAGRFDLEKFKAVAPTFEDRSEYLNTYAKPLNVGASRMVWDIGNKRVLKLLIPNGQINQNELEIKVWECSGRDSTVLEEMFEHAPDASWLTMEKLGKVNPSSFAKMVNQTLGWTLELDAKDAVNDLVDLLTPNKTRFHTRSNQWRFDWLKSHPSPWMEALRSLMRTCNLKHDDLWIRNWGSRGTVPVILDYGLLAD